MSDNRYVLTKYKGGVLAFTIDMTKNRLETVCFYEDADNAANIGDIYAAKVTQIVRGMNAAFISYGDGRRGYLPLETMNRGDDRPLRIGDEVTVQLEKEAVRSKEPVFSFQLSLAGKYCVVTNEMGGRCVSKKCSEEARERLRAAIPEDIEYSVVVRTNAEALTDTKPLVDECRRLSRKLGTILSDGAHRTCGSLLWRAPSPYLLPLRDNHAFEYDRIVTDDETVYQELSEFLSAYSPDFIEKLSRYEDMSYPLEKLYGVETKLDELLCKRVWLKSGAYLVIEKTEAMYVVDVNSGKNISKKERSRYIPDINLEAAVELMRQIRLRNLTGMIIVDFINMDSAEQKEQLMQELRRLAKEDSVKTKVVDMTALDLVEITRKKTVKTLQEQLEGAGGKRR